METYITICKIDSQWEFTVCLRKLKEGPRGMGWGGRWEGGSKGRGSVAPHSSPLTWKIPWTEEPGGLQSMGSLGVGHD